MAGVVGFALQLRQLRRERLHNLKLELEIEELRARLADKERRVVLPTTEEVRSFGRTRFSRIPAKKEAPALSRKVGHEAPRGCLLKKRRRSPPEP